MNAKNILQFALGPIVSAFLGFITLPLTTWIFSPEDIGRISLLLVISNFSVLFFSLGLDQSYVREYNEYSDKPSLFKMAIYPGAFLIFLTSAFVLFFGNEFSLALFDIEHPAYSEMIVLYIISNFVNRFLSLILRMEQRGLAYSFSQILPKVLLLIGIGALYITGINSFVYLLLIHVISVLSVVFLFAYNTRKTLFASITRRIDWVFQKTMLGFGLPLVLGSVAYWGLTAMDKLFIKYYSNYSELGVYSVAVSFAGVATLVQSIFSTVWSPIVYKWIADGKDLNKVAKVRDAMLFIIISVFIIAGLLSWVVNYLIPDEYTRVSYILVVCLASPLLYTLSETTVVGLGVTRNSNLSMLASLIAFIANLIGNFVLVPKFGAEGAAISTAVSFLVFFVLRTEFSIYVWEPIKRFKLYFLTVYILTVSILFMMYGSSNPRAFQIIWLFSLVILLFINKDQVKEAILKFKHVL